MSWTTTPPREFGWYWCREEDSEQPGPQVALVFPEEGYYPQYHQGDAKRFADFPKTEWIHEAIPRPDPNTGDYGLGRTRVKCSFGGDTFEAEGPAREVDSSFGAFMFALAWKNGIPTGPDAAPEKLMERVAPTRTPEAATREPARKAAAPAEANTRARGANGAYRPWTQRVLDVLPEMPEEFSSRDVFRAMLAAGYCEDTKGHKSQISEALRALDDEGAVRRGSGVSEAGGYLYRVGTAAVAKRPVPEKHTASTNGHTPTFDDALLDLDQARSLIEAGDRSGADVSELCERLEPRGWTERDSNLWRLTEAGKREWTTMQERMLRAQGVEA